MEPEIRNGGLPLAYAEALSLRDGGANRAEIAQHLGVDEGVAAALLYLAEAKSARLARAASEVGRVDSW